MACSCQKEGGSLEVQAPSSAPVEQKKPRHRLRRLLWGLAVFCFVVFALLFGARAYLFGWSWTSPPDCHESWSEEQRADLLAMDEALRHNQVLAAVPAIFWSEEMGHPLTPVLNDWLGRNNILSVALNYKEFAAPAREALHVAMQSGQGDVLTRRGEPLAVWALRLEMPDLFRELVKRGADVNHEYESLVLTLIGSPSTLAIEALSAVTVAGCCKSGAGKLSPDALHRRQLECLSGCKLSLDRPHLDRGVMQAILLGTMAGMPYSAQWALHQGYKPSPESRNAICCHLCSENHQEVLRELLREPALGQEDPYPSEYCTTLQFLFTQKKMRMPDMLELARILLESGADPNRLPHPIPDGESSLQKSPLMLALQNLSSCPQEERADALALIRLLIDHGARLAPGEVLAEDFPQDALQELNIRAGR